MAEEQNGLHGPDNHTDNTDNTDLMSSLDNLTRGSLTSILEGIKSFYVIYLTVGAMSKGMDKEDEDSRILASREEAKEIALQFLNIFMDTMYQVDKAIVDSGSFPDIAGDKFLNLDSIYDRIHEEFIDFAYLSHIDLEGVLNAKNN